jgi:hypothetical protein
LLRTKTTNNYCFEAQGTGSPITLLQGPKIRTAIEKAAGLTAYYSDRKQGAVLVNFGKEEFTQYLVAPILSQEEVEQL